MNFSPNHRPSPAWLPRMVGAALALAFATSASATQYLVVVPIKGRAVAGVTQPAIAVTLNAADLPAGAEGEAYPGFDFSTTLQVTGDVAFNPASVTWSVADGALPAGLTLSATGVLSGTPAGAGTSAFSVRASYRTKSGEQAHHVVVAKVTVALVDVRLPLAPLGQGYAHDFSPQLSVTGPKVYDVDEVTWTAVGALPTGLSLSPRGVLTGTPLLADAGSPVTVKASYKGKTAQNTYTVFPSDPLYGSVALMMHFDGSNGATAFLDSRGHTFSRVGAPSVSTSDSKFGGASLRLDGNSYIQSGYAADLSLKNDFTVEFWANISAHELYGGFLSFAGNPVNVGWQLIFDAYSNNVRFEGSDGVALVSSVPLPLNSWAHVALVRAGTGADNVRLYINGARTASLTYSGVLDSGGAPLYIGAERTSVYKVTGYIDDVRITQAARYTGAFTPPAVMHPSR